MRPPDRIWCSHQNNHVGNLRLTLFGLAPGLTTHQSTSSQFPIILGLAAHWPDTSATNLTSPRLWGFFPDSPNSPKLRRPRDAASTRLRQIFRRRHLAVSQTTDNSTKSAVPFNSIRRFYPPRNSRLAAPLSNVRSHIIGRFHRHSLHSCQLPWSTAQTEMLFGIICPPHPHTTPSGLNHQIFHSHRHR